MPHLTLRLYESMKSNLVIQIIQLFDIFLVMQQHTNLKKKCGLERNA